MPVKVQPALLIIEPTVTDGVYQQVSIMKSFQVSAYTYLITDHVCSHSNPARQRPFSLLVVAIKTTIIS